MAGMVGAIFNGALQVGSAVGLAAFSSIQTSVEATHASSEGHNGRTAAFWFLLGIVMIEVVCVAYFYQRETDQEDKVDVDGHSNKIAAIPPEEKSLGL